MIETTTKHIITTGDVARMLCVTPRFAATLMDAGRIKAWRMGRDRRTSLAAVYEFAAGAGIPLDELLADRASSLDGLGLPKPRGLRSHHWTKVANDHLALHPFCAACGCQVRKLLNVHHIKPFHVYPELELDERNLITLCESATHNCHLIFGHLLNWRSWNAEVVFYANQYAMLVANRPMPDGPPPARSTPIVGGLVDGMFQQIGAHAALDADETRRAA